MEQDFNYYLFKSAQFANNIQAVNIKPSPYVFEFNISQSGDQNCHLLTVISSQYPDKVVGKVFEKLSDTCRFIVGIKLDGMNLNDVSMKIIKNCAFLFITVVDLTSNRLTHVGAKYIYESGWKYLKRMQIGNNPLGNKGLSFLCKNNWPYLALMNLMNTNINDDGARSLTKAQWPNLNILVLSGNTFTNSTFKNIIICNFPNLTGVHFEDYSQQSNTFYNHNLVAKSVSGEIAYVAKYNYMPKSFFKVIRHKTDYQFLEPFDELSSDDEMQP